MGAPFFFEKSIFKNFEHSVLSEIVAKEMMKALSCYYDCKKSNSTGYS